MVATQVTSRKAPPGSDSETPRLSSHLADYLIASMSSAPWESLFVVWIELVLSWRRYSWTMGLASGLFVHAEDGGMGWRGATASSQWKRG